MSRSYTLKKRAEQQSETRRRIVEAAVDLHSTLGPARTPLSLIADRAGVQRKTLYAHFPDERSLFTACSGLTFERDPPPNAAAWRDIADCEERLRAGLGALYGYYERNAGLLACVLRDAEYHDLTRDTVEMRFGPIVADYVEVLGEGLSAVQTAMLLLALSFHSWRTLTRDGGLHREQAVAAMAEAILRSR